MIKILEHYAKTGSVDELLNVAGIESKEKEDDLNIKLIVNKKNGQVRVKVLRAE